MKRQDDRVLIESAIDGDFAMVIDRATQFEIGFSLRAPAYARLELGDSKTWGALRELSAIGTRASVSINGMRRVTGRILTRNMPTTPDGGTTVQLAFRTILADASFTACTPGINVQGMTLKALVLKAFERLGVTESDFVFGANTDRDAITGRKSGQPSAAAGIRYRIAKLDSTTVGDGVSAAEFIAQRKALETQLAAAQTRPVVPDLQEITVQQAAVQPGESVYVFVSRHLARHGLMIWDGHDGKIVIGKPDDSQDPVYSLTSLDGPDGQYNNLENATKTEDYEQVPSYLWVYGRDNGKGYAAAKSIKAYEVDPVLASVSPSLDRIAMIVDTSITSQALAEARARREMLSRSLAKDNWALSCDGLSYWTGREQLQWGINTMADVRVANSARADGAYLVHEVMLSGSADSGYRMQANACARGLWVL